MGLTSHGWVAGGSEALACRSCLPRQQLLVRRPIDAPAPTKPIQVTLTARRTLGCDPDLRIGVAAGHSRRSRRVQACSADGCGVIKVRTQGLLKTPSHRRTEVSGAVEKPLCNWGELAAPLLRKLWKTARCGESLPCANSDLAPGSGLAVGYSRGSLSWVAAEVFRKLNIRVSDYPAGSAWTRKIGMGLAIARVPEVACVFC
jgi:hypothetical protein